MNTFKWKRPLLLLREEVAETSKSAGLGKGTDFMWSSNVSEEKDFGDERKIYLLTAEKKLN